MIVHGVQPEELEKLFPFAAPWIFRIPRLSDRYKLQDVLKELQSGDWQLWVFVDEKIEGVLLTTITQYPLSRQLDMLGIAGARMKEWIDQIDIIENYARTNDCSRVVMVGARKGFTRMFRNYNADKVVLEKAL